MGRKIRCLISGFTLAAAYFLYQAFDTDDGGIHVDIYSSGNGERPLWFPRDLTDFVADLSEAAAASRS